MAGRIGRRGGAGWALLAVLVLVAVSAVYGGVALITDSFGMPADWLARTPFPSWVLPGVALLVTVAVPQLAAAWLVLRRSPWAALAGAVVGVALIAWIAVQLLVLRRYFFLQPVIAGAGVAELLLARRVTQRAG
jgi:hypothetical protein